jgi:hypothetical protein
VPILLRVGGFPEGVGNDVRVDVDGLHELPFCLSA